MVTPPLGFYDASPSIRSAALRTVQDEFRTELLKDISWPRMSPGTLNAWLAFIGPSPGASPGLEWNYEAMPAIGGPHPGVSDYEDRNGFWRTIRGFSRTIFDDMPSSDAYAQTMVRNLDDALAAVGPRGTHMHAAAERALDDLSRVNRPRLIVAIGGARSYMERAIKKRGDAQWHNSGSLKTALSRQDRPWVSYTGKWPTGEPYLVVIPSGIHPSLPHVAESDVLEFLRQQSMEARSL